MTAAEKILQTLRESASDFENGYGGTKAAARRARKALQDIRQYCKDAREELLAVMKDETEPKDIKMFDDNE